jgi:MFS superfamily sulfate permease-like transporter
VAIDTKEAIPRGNAAGFTRYLKSDLTSGLLVFLIALPLCLGISLASGFPPIAGVFTAIIGAILTTFLSNSELTIKGPAAGLIVIVIGCIEDFGGNGMIGGWDASDLTAYKAALAVGVVAAVLQIIFGIFRAGILGEFFPAAAVHGMLAAIGIIIMIKQFPVALGVLGAGGEPLEMLREVPRFIAQANPAIAAIGMVSLIIMFAWPTVRRKVAFLKPIPAPLIVLVVAVPMGMAFDLLHAHPYTLANHEYQLGDQYLVKMPDRVFGMFDDVTPPDMSVLSQVKAWKWIMMFFLIGTLESLLSAKAIDSLDPWKRKTNMNRDVIAVGVANLAAASVGGLPMISEIVRSKANIDNGAKTRFANFWHGIFLLLCVALIPTVLHRIPLAALAAMLVYTGFRLAHPTEFLNVWRIGKEQLAVFVTTLMMVLATDLLIGVAAGIVLKMVIHVANGVPLKSLFRPYLEVEVVDDSTSKIIAHQSAVFSNWIPFKRQIEEIGLVQKRNLIVDVSNTKLVDHSVMEKLGEIQRDFEQEGLTFEVRGLDSLRPLADNPHAARKSGGDNARLIIATLPSTMESEFLARLGTLVSTTRFVRLPCDVGSLESESTQLGVGAFTRIELIVSLAEYQKIDRELQFDSNEECPISLHVQPTKIRCSFPARANMEMQAIH